MGELPPGVNVALEEVSTVTMGAVKDLFEPGSTIKPFTMAVLGVLFFEVVFAGLILYFWHLTRKREA